MDKTLSQRHEREFAEMIPGGAQVLASGAKLDKHDVRTATKGTWKFRYELKCTQKKGFRFTAEAWKKLKDYVYGRSSEERPAYALRFYGEDTDRIANTKVLADLVIVELDDWCELLEELERYRGE